jgi:hypothetical protein
MKIQRRDFLKTSLAASAAATLVGRAEAASTGSSSTAGREYYELRAYRLKGDASRGLFDTYLEKALIPALNKRGIKNVGAFTEIEVDKNAVTSKPKADTPVWVFIPHASLDSVVTVSAEINNDPAVLKAGAGYLNVAKANPAFERIDSWLLLAFEGMPKMQVPSFTKSKNRVYEFRTYESHSEAKALNKIAMFNAGEIQVMKELDMSPVFYGQALVGRDLPHLSYFTGGTDLATHLANWKKFGTHPIWVKLKGDPQYVDNTSKTSPARFLAPTAYSQI